MKTKNENEEFLTKEKDKFQLGWYDKKGYLNKQLINKIFFFGFATLFFLINYIGITINYLLTYDVNLSEFFTMDMQSEYIANVFEWYKNTILDYEYFSVQDNWQFIITNSAAIIIPVVLFLKLLKYVKGRAEIQSFLASNGLNQYYLYKKDGNVLTFKLIKGESVNYQGFLNSADDIKQQFQVGKLKASRNEKDKVILEFMEETPELSAYLKGVKYKIEDMENMVADGMAKDDFTMKTTCLRTDFKEFLGVNKSMLGVQDIKGKPLYASFPSTVGAIQGHVLINGGTGSGKSFMTTNYVKSILMSDANKYIDHIYVINMKEDSNDWEFLKGVDKATVGSGLEDALNILKEAELKMLANNRWNSLNNEENTNFGQVIVIIDEIHKFRLISGDKTQPKTVQLVAEKCETIIDTLATQARSANLFIIGILQKATLDMLSGVFRSMCINRILLKSDTITSHIVIDEEVQKENMIDSNKLTSGQFIYYNMQNGLIKIGFAVESVKFNASYVNQYKEADILIKGRAETKELVDLAVIVAQLKAEQAVKDSEDKNFKDKVNDYSNRKAVKRDYWKEAQEIYENGYSEEDEECDEPLTVESVEEEKKEEVERVEIDPDLKTLLLEHKKKKTEKKLQEAESIESEKLEEDFEKFDLDSFENEEKHEAEIEKLEEKKAKKEDEIFLNLEKEFEKNINEDGTIKKTDTMIDMLESL